MTARLDWDHPPEVAEVRRWRLLAAGRRVIEARGLRFTVADVTREAGVAKGTFYTYFRSREAFLDALRAALGADVFDAVQAAAEGPWAGIFVRMMSAVTGWMDANPGLVGLFDPAYLSRPDRPTKGPLFTLVAQVIRDGIDLGVFRPGPMEGDDTVSALATVVYDILSAGITRVSPVAGDAAPADVTAQFVQRALGFDPQAARGRRWIRSAK